MKSTTVIVLVITLIISAYGRIEFRNNKFYDGGAETIVKGIPSPFPPLHSFLTVLPKHRLSLFPLSSLPFTLPNVFYFSAVGYAPVPIGSDPTVQPPYGDYFTSNYASIYKRDLTILRYAEEGGRDEGRRG